MTWRSTDDDDEPQRINAVLGEVSRQLGAPALDVLRSILDGWPELVGGPVAENLRPVTLRDDVLVVETADPMWARQMEFLAPQLVTRLNEALGSRIARIEVRVRRH